MYNTLKQKCADLVAWPYFMYGITALIIINSILIGVEIDKAQWEFIAYIQKGILILFTIEIFIRWFGKESVKKYISNGWNWFDIVIVAITYVPESWLPNAELLTVMRILRVFRVFRLIKIFPELQTITRVLFKSIASLFFVSMLMLLVMYIYAIIGVILFKGSSTVINSQGEVIDPFGTVPESMFSLFRVLTGEDWTDLRYNLLFGQSGYADWLVSVFFLSWFIISGYLLINIVVGAVVNNYDKVMAQDMEEAIEAANKEEHDFIEKHFLEMKDEIRSLKQKINDLEK